MTEVISGLHICQPKNVPNAGDTKNFAVLNMPAKGGKKAWIKIKSEPPDKGGSPYRVVAVTPTGWEPDEYGNVALNLEIEAVSAPAPRQDAPQRTFTASGGDDRSSRIERQHSQEMALRYFALTGKVPTTQQLRDMVSWFQRDVSQSPVISNEPEPAEEPEEDLPF